MQRSGSQSSPTLRLCSQWLAERMARLGLAITETLIGEYGKAEVLPAHFWTEVVMPEECQSIPLRLRALEPERIAQPAQYFRLTVLADQGSR